MAREVQCVYSDVLTGQRQLHTQVVLRSTLPINRRDILCFSNATFTLWLPDNIPCSTKKMKFHLKHVNIFSYRLLQIGWIVIFNAFVTFQRFNNLFRIVQYDVFINYLLNTRYMCCPIHFIYMGVYPKRQNVGDALGMEDCDKNFDPRQETEFIYCFVKSLKFH